MSPLRGAFAAHGPAVERLVYMVGVLLDSRRLHIDSLAAPAASSPSKSSSSSGNSGSGSTEHVDDEALSVAGFHFFGLVLQHWVPSDESATSSSASPFAGPFLAHAVQLSLAFATHRSKRAASAALTFLHAALAAAASAQDQPPPSPPVGPGPGPPSGSAQEQWCMYLPGVFSGLHAVCMLPTVHR